MSYFNYELSLMHSPYFDKLLKEMKYLLEQKRKLLFGVKNKSDFNSKLSFTDKGIYDSILKREKELLLEMIHIKDWTIKEEHQDFVEKENSKDYDIYDTNTLTNFT